MRKPKKRHLKSRLLKRPPKKRKVVAAGAAAGKKPTNQLSRAMSRPPKQLPTKERRKYLRQRQPLRPPRRRRPHRKLRRRNHGAEADGRKNRRLRGRFHLPLQFLPIRHPHTDAPGTLPADPPPATDQELRIEQRQLDFHFVELVVGRRGVLPAKEHGLGRHGEIPPVAG
jgi:hypothetical protein